MRKLGTLLMCVFFIHFTSFEQAIRRPAASGYIGCGAYSTYERDAFSFTSNQAALTDIKKVSGGIYGERKFLLRELSFYSAAIVLPTHSGNFGIKTVYSGFSDYYETQAGLAYGRRLGDRINVGLQFNYFAFRVAGYGGAAAFFFEAGTLIHLTANLQAGIHLYNPVGGRLDGNTGEKLPFVYTTALGYDVSPQFSVNVEVEKEEDRPSNVNACLQYRLIPRIKAKGGIAIATSRLWLGIGITVRTFRIEITASYHPQLGATPGLLLLFDNATETNAQNEQ